MSCGLDEAPQQLKLTFQFENGTTASELFDQATVDASPVIKAAYEDAVKSGGGEVSLDFRGTLVLTVPSREENRSGDPIMATVLRHPEVLAAYERVAAKYQSREVLALRQQEAAKLIVAWLQHYGGDMERARRDLRCYNHTGLEKDQIAVKNEDFRMEMDNYTVANLFVQLNPISLMVLINFSLKYDIRVLWHHATAAICSYNKNKSTQEIELTILGEAPARAVATPDPYLRVARDKYGVAGSVFFTTQTMNQLDADLYFV